jgi:hypothetical protein
MIEDLRNEIFTFSNRIYSNRYTIIGYFAVIFGYIYPKYGEKDESVIIDISVGFGGLIIMEGVSFFMGQIIETKRSKEGKQNEHKQRMMTQLENPLEVVLIDYDQNLDESKDKIYWRRSPVFEKFLVHLQAYPDLDKSYKDIVKDGNTMGNVLIAKINEYRSYVTNKINLFTELPESDHIQSNEKPVLLKNVLVTEIARNTYDLLSENTRRIFKINKNPIFVLCSLSGHRAQCAVGDEETLETFGFNSYY